MSADRPEPPRPFSRAVLGARLARAPRPPVAVLVLAALAAPALALAHERWVANKPRFPVNRAYFQAMRGEVLLFSLGAAAALFSVIVLWYLTAPPIVDALTPVTASAKAREARRHPLVRALRAGLRFALDGPVDSAFMRRGLIVADALFTRVPAFVLALGAYQGWLVMPSYPLPTGALGAVLRVVEVILAVWAGVGLFLPPLGAILLVVYVYLCFAYGIAAVDAVPVLASAFHYLFRRKGGGVNARQLAGIRASLGIGFFLLGVVNKIYLGPDLFIGVGDQHPELLLGPQALFPGLTREAWCFTTALGEMTFGLLLFAGVFNRVITLILAFVFTNFIFVFGLDEIVHVYPVAGFVILFFRGSPGTSFDGLLFRLNVRLFGWLRHTSARLVYGGAVTTVAVGAAALLMFLPLVLVTEVAPVLAGTEVARNYVPPAPAPPASEWGKTAPAPPVASASRAPPKPHADHEPRHGGVVTMSGELHVEVVVSPSGGVFLYASDAVRKPIPPAECKGSVRVERPGLKTTLQLHPERSGALTAAGPPPKLAAEYTYALTVRGAPASLTLPVPAGGTDATVKPKK